MNSFPGALVGIIVALLILATVFQVIVVLLTTFAAPIAVIVALGIVARAVWYYTSKSQQ